MSVVVEVTVPAESFTFFESLAAAPEMVVEAERVASHSPEWSLPFLWASGGDFEAFHDGMEDDPTVEDFSSIENHDGEALYKVKWCEPVHELIAEMINQHAIILEAQGQDERWRLRLRFADESQVKPFREHFAERGHAFDVVHLYRPSAPRQREYGLTAAQREAMVTALRLGYFNVPRDRDIEAVAGELGISSNAVSQRLRRATTNLLHHTLTISTDTSQNDR